MEFRHVPGEVNPADLATRGITPKELETAKIWWHGPQWLQNDEQHWPNKIFPLPPETGEESTEQFANVAKTIARGAKMRPKPDLDPNRFSGLTEMIFVMMYTLRFIRSLMALTATQSSKILKHFSLSGKFTALDFKIGERILIKQAQNRSGLSENEKIRREFSLFEDTDGIWRSKSRLHRSLMPMQSIEPIFLPRDDRITPVSYTHLDVYKRQKQLCPAPFAPKLAPQKGL